MDHDEAAVEALREEALRQEAQRRDARRRASETSNRAAAGTEPTGAPSALWIPLLLWAVIAWTLLLHLSL